MLRDAGLPFTSNNQYKLIQQLNSSEKNNHHGCCKPVGDGGQGAQKQDMLGSVCGGDCGDKLEGGPTSQSGPGEAERGAGDASAANAMHIHNHDHNKHNHNDNNSNRNNNRKSNKYKHNDNNNNNNRHNTHAGMLPDDSLPCDANRTQPTKKVYLSRASSTANQSTITNNSEANNTTAGF
jgi:hypothetical protein